MIMSFQHSHNLQETNIRLSPTMIANRKHENLHVFLRLTSVVAAKYTSDVKDAIKTCSKKHFHINVKAE